MQYHKDQTLALQEYLGSSSSLDLKSQPGPSLVENITTTEMQYHKNQAAAQDLECQPGPSFCNVLKNITNSYTQHHKVSTYLFYIYIYYIFRKKMLLTGLIDLSTRTAQTNGWGLG
ncbi:unnamed protein product [Parnassius mnemosyne]